ncbi:transglycosylase domain-containing protein [Cytobacillus sp. Hz8]|uniref:transglycosylase domain-containing protein n=1 Tax=Cytobacillus sp. Hz8 TaxID=3347168 RepID=UPI0035DADB1B
MFLIISTASETDKIQSFDDVLDEKIQLNQANLTLTSYIEDANHHVISEMYGPVNRIYLKMEDIPSFLKDIFIVSEDQHFYEHRGFDVSAIARALTINMRSNNIEQGASTITQQLARNLYLNYEKTYNRKLSELLYAYKLEQTYSKDEILELYINTIYFSQGTYGIEAASEKYFQKKTSKLSKAELAFLAAIPNNPSLYDPLKTFGRTKERQERLLIQMSEQGYLSREEANQLIKEPIQLKLKKRIDAYPDYTTYVESELKELISHKEGYDIKLKRAPSKDRAQLEQKLAQRVEEVIHSGIIIHTALDTSVQKRAVSAIKTYLPYQDIEGAAAVINHKKHELIALVGGKNYKKYNFNRGYQAYRQPGSSIKPLLDYAPYIERTHSSLVSTIDAGPFCSKGYCPKNYGGATYGMVTLEQAFIHSYNTPAIRLLNTIGIENGFKDLSHFQFQKVGTRDHTLAAAIGGFTYGMTPLELTGAYTVFGDGGSYLPPHAITKVTDIDGKLLYKWDDKSVQVWSQATVDKIRTLMQKTVTSGTARKAYFPSDYVGGKTGTTNDYKDYWFVGLTKAITAGVWVGRDNSKSIQSIESNSPQLYIWKSIVSGY